MHTKQLALPLLLALSCGAARADVIPFLGAAQQFAVLGAQSVTNTGATTLHGDLGAAQAAAITGASGITFVAGGAPHGDDAAARQARTDANVAYARLAALAGGTDLSGRDLGSVGSLTSGIYRYAAAAALTGTLTLDFANDPTGIIVFLIGSALTTASDSVVNVLNATSSNGIYFQVGSSATLGDHSIFAGNILAAQSVTFAPASGIVCGRALALGATVTLTGNTVSSDCNAYAPTGLANDYGSMGYSGYGMPAAAPAPVSGKVPEPATPALFMLGLCAAAALRRRPRR
jgi:hypothetical protein